MIPAHLKKFVLRGYFGQFLRLENARSFAYRLGDGFGRIVLGDHDENGGNGKYWVVCPSDAARLEKAGYEIIR